MTPRLARIAALAAALCPSLARADEPTAARLAWVRGDGAERCPDTTAIAARVVALLQGADPFRGAPTRSIEAAVERDEDGWHARIYDRDAAGALVGARAFDADEPDCEGVAQASALTIALALNHGALPPAPTPVPPPPTTPVPPPPVVAPPVVAPPTPAPTRSTAPRPGLELSSTARVALAAGYTPSPSPLFALHTEGAVRGRLRWMAEVLTTTASSPEGATAYAFRFSGARLGACVEAWRTRLVMLEGCAAVVGAAVTLVVTDLRVDDADPRLWLGASLDAVARFTPARPLVLEAGVSAATPFVHPRYEDVRNRAPGPSLVYESPLIAAMVWIGAGVSIR